MGIKKIYNNLKDFIVNSRRKMAYKRIIGSIDKSILDKEFYGKIICVEDGEHLFHLYDKLKMAYDYGYEIERIFLTPVSYERIFQQMALMKEVKKSIDDGVINAFAWTEPIKGERLMQTLRYIGDPQTGKNLEVIVQHPQNPKH